MPRPALAALALLAGCALNNMASDADGGLDFDIGGIRLRVSSGTGRVMGGSLGLYLTDQPDACLAVTQVPVGMAVIFSLRVAPQGDGTKSASVVRGRIVPGPGEAVGEIRAQTGGVETASHEDIDGTVTWKDNDNGTYTIVSLDVGFDGSANRLRATELTVPPCQ